MDDIALLTTFEIIFIYQNATGYRQLSGDAEIGELGVTFGVEENVSGLDVAVDLLAEVEVLQT